MLVPSGTGVWQGDTITVVGVLKVFTIPAAVRNGVEAPGVTSATVVGVRVK